MKSFFLTSILIVGLIFILASETEEGVVYYVSPTKPLSSCPGNSSCPPGQHCPTMDYLAKKSGEFFSPDQISVTLIFMCGVHNYTKDLTVQNLHSFIMKGAAESRDNVIIDHQFTAQFGKLNYCKTIQFFNVSFVNITALTMRCPAINLKECHITVKSSSLYGYTGIEESIVSFINITKGRGLLQNCTIKENCFIMIHFSESDGIIVINSTFQSYRHQTQSIIEAISSVVTLTGSVNFTDSIIGINQPGEFGTAVFLINTQPELKHVSSLIITTGATVYFVNLTCSGDGGAVYANNGMILIHAKARVFFMYNVAQQSGGALYLSNGTITVGKKSNVHFANNLVHNDGGAISISNGVLSIDTDASLIFSHNHAGGSGGAVCLENGDNISNAKLKFALYNGTVYINSSTSLKFISNTAQVQGGAIYIGSISTSITVGDSAKLLLLNNSAFQGGALYVVQSSFTISVGYQSRVQFINNTAFEVGGAVYAEMQPAAPCLFMITDYSAEISFMGNHANHSVGHHMYGSSTRSGRCDERIITAYKQGKPYCWRQYQPPDGHINISFDNPDLHANKTLSPVSSAPQRVCLCDSNGKPQCANMPNIFTHISIYRGETFTLSACVVGYDFGTTAGVVHAGFLNPNHLSQLGHLQDNQQVKHSEKCTYLEYTIFSKFDTEVLLLQISVLPVSIYVNKEANKNSLSSYMDKIKGQVGDYSSHHDDGCLDKDLLKTPVFINITLLHGCPPGLTINFDHNNCSCYPILASDTFMCLIQKKTGFLQWNSTMWVNSTFNESHSTGIIYNRFCPLNYCKSGNKTVNIGDDPSKQCASNRTGILCGACMDNFSLAIGSSRCIECLNSHNVALLLAFAAAGVFLVFLILAINLTVTQGLINGVIFYANIVWAYKVILFPSEVQENHWLVFLQIFVAWLNLDFGIETCFFVGLDAYSKTWLQFLFPFYIWAIAGVIIVGCRYSSRLTDLIGSRAVPLLATLFLLSYMKLLHTIIDATSVAVIAQYPQNTSYAVWYLDGNLHYCQYPHIYLFIAAIATLVFLWLPYTLLLLFIQPLRRVSHLRPLKWINKLAPVYDAYFYPLKDKHHYWFGALLLVRGILLVILTITSAANPELNMFMVFLFIALLIYLISVENVYKRIHVRLLESATLLNLTVLSAGTLYKWESTTVRMILLEVSIGITFSQFCIIVVLSLIKTCLSSDRRCRQNQSYDVINKNFDYDIAHERIEDPELEALINYTPRPIAVEASVKVSS